MIEGLAFKVYGSSCRVLYLGLQGFKVYNLGFFRFSV
jgi:hypothetical protein